MAPRQSRKARVVEPSESEDSQGSLQDVDEELIAARKIITTHASKRESKRKNIETDHEKLMKDARNRLDELFQTRKSRVSKAQKVLCGRLDALNKKRQNLERAILTSMKTIQIHTMNISSEISATFEGRMEEIESQSSPVGSEDRTEL